LLFLAVATVANAASMTVGLEPRGGAGPYASGATVVFDVRYTNDLSIPMVMRLFQHTNVGSDAEVQFVAISTDTVPGMRFGSPITSANGWQRYLAWTQNPQVGWSGTFYDDDPESENYNGSQTINLGAGSDWFNQGTGTTTKTGAFGVIAPDFECCDPPDQVFWSAVFAPEGDPGNPLDNWCDWAKVDIVSGTDPDVQGRIQANGLPGADPDGFLDMLWSAGDLAGGMGWFYCVPEPASLGLLGLGMLVVLRRRR